jgi:hypothetical protein
MALSPTFKSCFREQVAVIDSGVFWNCLAAAETLAALLLSEGRSPWIGRLRKTEARGDTLFHGPLIAVGSSQLMAWTTHYVCVDRGIVYDPVGSRPMPLRRYSKTVFGEDVPIETFVAQEEMGKYLASKNRGTSS